MLSVLLPYRNSEKTLGEALESILKQTFSEFELLAVNDCSSDNSTDILESYRDERIRILQNSGEGLVDALNFGIENAQHEWIVRMDSDDIMHPCRLEKLHHAISIDPELDLVASRVEIFPRENMKAGYREYLRWQNDILTSASI